MSFINTDSFSIIGSESQSIQIILHKNEKMNINKKYLISSSSNELREIVYNKMNQIFSEKSNGNSNNQNLKRVDSPSIINLKNTQANIEYICLSKGGKIMIINPNLYYNLYIKLDSILAFNNGIELYTDKKTRKLNTLFFYRNILRRNNFRRNIFQENNDQVENDQFCLIKAKVKTSIEEDNLQNLSSLIFTKNNIITDLIFISGKSSLFEKRLGEGESMILNNTSLIAFEGSITLEMLPLKRNNYKKYVNPFNYLIIKGPGLIIFEPSQQIIPIMNNKKRRLIIVVITFLIIFFNILIHIVLSLD